MNPSPLPQGVVEIESGKGGRLVTQIRAGSHEFVGDEPVTLGGTGRGPNPYDLLLASLGSCTSITMRLYAERKGWPLENVRVHLSHAKLYARDCEECARKEGKVDRIERTIEIEGPLSEEQRARLIEIAKKCPICRTLSTEISVRTTLSD